MIVAVLLIVPLAGAVLMAYRRGLHRANHGGGDGRHLPSIIGLVGTVPIAVGGVYAAGLLPEARPVESFLAGLAAVAYWAGAAAGRPDARAEARPQAYDSGFLDGIQARDSVGPDDRSP